MRPAWKIAALVLSLSIPFEARSGEIPGQQAPRKFGGFACVDLIYCLRKLSRGARISP